MAPSQSGTTTQTLRPGSGAGVASEPAGRALDGHAVLDLPDHREPPVARRSGERAEIASTEAELTRAREAGDEREGPLSWRLACAFFHRGRALGRAVQLARRAAMLGGVPGLDEQLAQWLVLLGRHSLAGGMLRGMVESRPDRALEFGMRSGLALARAGRAREAAAALLATAEAAAGEPAPLEMLGALGPSAPEELDPEQSSQAFVLAAERRASRGERTAAFEDQLRALELSTTSLAAADAVIETLVWRGRLGAADEVARRRADREARRTELHRARVHEALIRGDSASALGAALDAQLECRLDWDGLERALSGQPRFGEEMSFDEVLGHLGHEAWLLARLEVFCALDDEPRAAWQLAQQISDVEPVRARWLLARAIAQPRSDQSFLRRSLAWTEDDPGLLVDALCLLELRRDESWCADRVVAIVEEIVRLTHAGLVEPEVLLWAVGRIDEIPSGWHRALEKAARSIARRPDWVSRALDEAERGEGVEQALRLTPLLPEREQVLAQSLADRLEGDPGNARYLVCLERLLLRRGRERELSDMLARVNPTDADSESAIRNSRVRCLVRTAPGEALALLRTAPGERPEASRQVFVEAVFGALLSQDREGRNAALELAASALPLPARATVTACLAENLAPLEPDRARGLAEAALALDPGSARAATVLCSLATGERGADDARALERAVQVVVARADVCGRLSRIYFGLGQPLLSLIWAQRWLAVRAGDANAIEQLVRCVSAVESAERIAEVVTQILSQPLAVERLAVPVVRVIQQLLKVDPERATQAGWQVLDALGPQNESVSRALLEIADTGGASGLAIATIERTLADSALRSPEGLVQLARRRRLAGDREGAAWVLCEAEELGGPPSDILAEIDALGEATTSDGILWQTRARAGCLERQGNASLAADTWRQLGALLWDLAQDPQGAVDAWQNAAALSPGQGLGRLASDLVEFEGHAAALTRLRGLAAHESNAQDQARIWAVVADVAYRAGMRPDAFDAAVRTIGLDPSASELLALAERCADGVEQYRLLAAVYGNLADVALGRYGERAASYRGARYFEQRGELLFSLPLAQRALEAVPAEGVTLALFERVCADSGNAERASLALRSLAEKATTAAARKNWLLRAARLPGADVESSIRLVLVALQRDPDADTVDMLANQLAVASDVLKEGLRARVREVAESVLAGLEGPAGARLALRFSSLALSQLRDPQLAWQACGRAIDADGSIDEFATVVAELPSLMSEPNRAIEFAQRLLSGSELNLGEPALSLGLAVASSLGNDHLRASLLIRLCHLDPVNLEDCSAALSAAFAAGDKELVESAWIAAGGSRDPGVVWTMVELADKRGAELESLFYLERAATSADVDSRARARQEIAQRLKARGEGARLREAIRGWLAVDELDAAERSRWALDFAALALEQDDRRGALEVLSKAVCAAEVDVAVGEEGLVVARLEGDDDAERMMLEWLRERCQGSRRWELTAQLAEHLERHGNVDRSVGFWREVAEANTKDLNALAALQRDAERRCDWPEVERLLASRLPLVDGDEKRRLSIHHAAVLDQHMGRSEDARQLLSKLLAEDGDHPSVLRVLADIEERLGEHASAAERWEQASQLAPTAADAARLRARAARNYLECRRPKEAAAALDHASSVHLPEEVRNELRVSIARALGDGLALAEALEPLAEASTGTPEERAALLLEAAYGMLASARPDDALRLGQRAAALAPSEPEPQLLARWLEYLQRGPGTMEHAATTVSQLRGTRGRLAPEQVELRGFLLAEALDVVAGRGAGLRELLRAHSECGPRPLVAVGLAERLAEGQDPAQALGLFDAALTGELRGVRSPGEVALRAAETCIELGEVVRGGGYLERARHEPGCRAAADRLALRLQEARAALQAGAGTPAAGADCAVTSSDVDSAAPGVAKGTGALVLSESGFDAGTEPAELSESERPTLVGDEMPVSTEESAASTVLSAESVIEGEATAPSVTDATPERSAALPHRSDAEDDEDALLPPVLARDAPVSEKTVRILASRELLDATRNQPGEQALEEDAVLPGDLEPPSTQQPARLRIAAALAVASAEEERLLEALRDGDIAAGERLEALLERREDRCHDRLDVCRMLSILRPTDVASLQRLVAAALADRNVALASAVQHVVEVFSCAECVSSPPARLDQQEGATAVQALLLRDAAPVSEVLGLVVEGCDQAYRQELSKYGVTGVERIGGAGTPLATAVSAATRWFGQARTKAFQRRGPGGFSVTVALVSPPALVISGEPPEDSVTLDWSLAYHVAAAMPQNALAFGMAGDELRRLLVALTMAFGSHGDRSTSMDGAPHLAELFWQLLPGRSQRRLRELCGSGESLSLEAAVKSGRRACRRAGLLYTGDFRDALRRCATEEAVRLTSGAMAGSWALRYCERSAAALDLLRLATSSEYAEIRWQRRLPIAAPESTWGRPLR